VYLVNEIMDHVAFMRKEWGFGEKVLSGEKIIESRWYKNKYRPWAAISVGDVIYFKENNILAAAKVRKVIQFSDLGPKKIREILNTYGKDTGIESNEKFFQLVKDKKYCILIFLKNVQKIKPFKINKKGFGNMASWITVKKIKDIRM